MFLSWGIYKWVRYLLRRGKYVAFFVLVKLTCLMYDTSTRQTLLAPHSKGTQVPANTQIYTMFLASRASGCLFGHPNTWKEPPQDTQIFLCGISKNLNLKLIIECFHLLIIPMTLFNDIMPYFDEFIHVYYWNTSILWRPKILQLPILGTHFYKSWLRHCIQIYVLFKGFTCLEHFSTVADLAPRIQN